MSLKIKLNIVNKKEYELNENYREIVIKIPKKSEDLEKDFNYLGLDYNNLSIQDSHVLNCEVIDTEDSTFDISMSKELSNIIARGNESGFTTPFQDIKSMFDIMRCLNNEERRKLLAVLELKREQICNMKNAVKYGNNLNCFEFYNNIHSAEDYAEKLIEDGDVDARDITEYIDMERLGDDYYKSEEGVFTEQGLIFEKEYIDKTIKIQRENEEEFE